MASRQRFVSNRVRQYQVLALLLAAVLVYLVVSRHLFSSASSLLFFVVLIPSIILHEVSHGAVAYLLGDDTAKRAGRLTLNPIRHIDPLGSVILPALLLLSHFPVFGYAKPVPVNVGQLRSPRNHSVLVSLAGPATNIVLAALAWGAMRLFPPANVFLLNGSVYSHGPISVGYQLLFDLGIVNIFLAAFNLIPLPPLDGSAVVERLLPRALWPGYLRLRMYSLPIVLLGVLLLSTVLSRASDSVYLWWSSVVYR